MINVRYKDLWFASVGEGLGVNLLHGDHYRGGLAITYDLGRLEENDISHLHGLGDINRAPAVKAFMSVKRMARWTGMTARVRGVRTAAAEATSRQ